VCIAALLLAQTALVEPGRVLAWPCFPVRVLLCAGPARLVGVCNGTAGVMILMIGFTAHFIRAPPGSLRRGRRYMPGT
jgi:hypothetical protein